MILLLNNGTIFFDDLLFLLYTLLLLCPENLFLYIIAADMQLISTLVLKYLEIVHSVDLEPNHFLAYDVLQLPFLLAVQILVDSFYQIVLYALLIINIHTLSVSNQFTTFLSIVIIPFLIKLQISISFISAKYFGVLTVLHEIMFWILSI